MREKENEDIITIWTVFIKKIVQNKLGNLIYWIFDPQSNITNENFPCVDFFLLWFTTFSV